MRPTRATAIRNSGLLGGSLLLGVTQFGGLVLAEDGGVAAALVTLLFAPLVGWWGLRASATTGPRAVAHGYLGAFAIVAVASGGQCLGINADGGIDDIGGAIIGFGLWVLGTGLLVLAAIVAWLTDVSKGTKS